MRDIQSAMFQFWAGERWAQRTSRLASYQQQPNPGLGIWEGLETWGTVLHLSPLFVLFPQNVDFFF